MSSAFRVTHRSIHRSAMVGLQGNLERMQRLQEQLSSGRAVQRPSDSPTATASAMQFRSEVRRTEQFVRNADDGRNWLGTTDTTLTQVLGVSRRVRELVLRGMNASMGQTEREAMAAEVESLRAGLVDLANTRYLDRPIFAGTEDTAAAYAQDGTYLGNVGDETSAAQIGKVERSVAPGMKVRVNFTGPEVFGTPGADLFTTVARIADHLRNDPSQLSADLQALDGQVVDVQNHLAKVGARYHQVEAMQNRSDDELLRLRGSLSEVEDIDLPKTIVDLQLQEVAYQSALSATARVIQPSLLDFLR